MHAARRRSAARRPLCFNTHMQPARGWGMLCSLYSVLAHSAAVVWSYRATDRRAWGPMATVRRRLSTATKLRGTAWHPRTMAMAMAHKRLAATKVRGPPACPDFVVLFTPDGGSAPVPRQSNLTRVHARLRCLTDEFCLCKGATGPRSSSRADTVPQAGRTSSKGNSSSSNSSSSSNMRDTIHKVVATLHILHLCSLQQSNPACVGSTMRMHASAHGAPRQPSQVAPAV